MHGLEIAHKLWNAFYLRVKQRSAIGFIQFVHSSPNVSACINTSSTAASAISGGYLYLRNIRFTINRKRARTLSRFDQSTVMFLRKFSVS